MSSRTRTRCCACRATDGRPLLIVITGDRGLSGSFNSNVIKAAGQFIVNEGRDREIALGLIGRKGRDFFRRRGFDVRYEAVGIFQRLSFNDAKDIANVAIDEFTAGTASSVYLVYNEFKSVMTQRIVVERLLPIPRLEQQPTRRRPGRRLPLRAGAGRRSSRICCPGTCRCRSIARCSNRTRRSSRRR